MIESNNEHKFENTDWDGKQTNVGNLLNLVALKAFAVPVALPASFCCLIGTEGSRLVSSHEYNI